MLSSSIRKCGYSLVNISPSAASHLEETIRSWQSHQQYRFPPPTGLEYAKWPSQYQQSYRILLEIAKSHFQGILMEQKSHPTLSTLVDRLVGDKVNFDASFMNIFNYNYGHLGSHRDRCLVTLIYRQYTESKADPGAKSLWCQAPHLEGSQEWQNIDDALRGQRNKACLLIGEELSMLSSGHLPAAIHCVMKEPVGPDMTRTVSVSPPPSTDCNLPANNRQSVALILSSAEISAIIDESFS